MLLNTPSFYSLSKRPTYIRCLAWPWLDPCAQMCLYNLFLTNKSRDEQSKWLTIIKCCQTTCVLAAIDSAFKAFAWSLIIISGLRELTLCGGRGDDHNVCVQICRAHMWHQWKWYMKGALGARGDRISNHTENITRAQTSINMRLTPSILI